MSKSPHGLLALLVAFACLAGGPAASQEEEARGVEITPAIFEYDLPDRSFRVKLLLVNHLDEPRRLDLSVSGLGHDLDGNPQFLEPAVATEVTTLTAERFVLAARQRRELILQGAIPESDRSLYAAVIAEFEPLEETERQIPIRSRVASFFLLRGPKPWIQTLKVVDVGAVQTKKGKPLTVYAAARNTGDVHFRPRGFIRILRDGRLLDTVRLKPQRVIPTFARRLAGTWDPPRNLSGALELEAVFTSPAEATGTAVVSFTEDGELVRPAASIAEFTADALPSPEASLILTNTGTITFSPVVTLTAAEGPLERARRVIVERDLRPGEERTVTWNPEVGAGVYLLKAEVTFEEQLLADAAVGLEVPTHVSLLNLIALVLLIVTSLFLAATGWRRWRLRAAR